MRRIQYWMGWQAAILSALAAAAPAFGGEETAAAGSSFVQTSPGDEPAAENPGTTQVSEVLSCPAPGGSPSYCNPGNLYCPTEPGAMFGGQAAPDGTMPAPATAPAQSQFTAASTSDVAAPNMIGDLLRAYRGVSFTYLSAGDFAVANSSGAVNFRNSKVADNNSAIPRDRVAFRYNYFRNAQDIAGLQGSGEFGPLISQTGTSPVRQFEIPEAAGRSYDFHLYTFSFEKTFLDETASMEVRLPFGSTLNSDLNLVSGELLFDEPTLPLVEPTPERTLGNSDTEMQNIQLILKGILWRSAGNRVIVSGGLALDLPTGQDLNVRVVDYSNDDPLDLTDKTLNPGAFPAGDVAGPDQNEVNAEIARRFLAQFVFDQRIRQFNVKNETVGLSPFLAMVATPTRRTFVTGFTQLDVPLNKSSWSYKARDIDLESRYGSSIFDDETNTVVTLVPASEDPAVFVQYEDEVTGKIRDQVLLHFDLGGGYWHYLNPRARYVTGVASILELHYTTTLQSGDLEVVDATRIRANPTDPFVENAPLIGNLGKSVDLLNLTVGSNILLGQRASLTVGAIMPLREGPYDRTFDAELTAQFNLFR